MPRPTPLLLSAVVLCVLPLALGLESILLVGLPGGLPLGTLLAALALVAGAAVPVVASRRGAPLWWVGLVTLVGTALWLPVGIALSGSASLSFVNDGADAALFWRMTAWLGALVLLTMGWAAVDAWVHRRGRTESASTSPT